MSFLAATSQAEETGNVPKLADMPVGITSFGATFHDGAIYVFGGQAGPAHHYNREEVSQPLYRLPYAEGAEWVALPTKEPALGPALLSHSSGLIRIGGMQPQNDPDEEQNMISVPFVHRFDPATETWSELPDLPEGRSSHDAWIVGDKIYVAGGWKMRGVGESSRWSKYVDVLDLSESEPQWKRIPQPFFRRALAVAILGEELFCLGGLDKAGEASLEVDILNLRTEEWKKGPELPDGPIKGFGLAAAVENADGKLYITGFDGKVHTYTGDGWEKVDELANGRMFARFVDPPDSSLVILGGAGKEGRPLALEFVSGVSE
ncbi:MAG: hypothetical protein AAF491_08900 [Verrucomicrobiota bacterium]